MLRGCFIVILSLAFLFSNYSINFFVKAEETKETTNDSSDEKNMIIISDNQTKTENAVDRIIDKNKDPAFEEVQDKVKNNEMDVSVVSSNSSPELEQTNSVAADVSIIKENESHREFLKDELEDGKRVILYGDVQPEEYKEILDLDEISVEEKEGKLEFGLNEEEMQEKAIENGKEETKTDSYQPNDLENSFDKNVEEAVEGGENDPDKEIFEAEESEFTSHVIGYTLDKSQELQFVDVSINNFDEYGNPIPNTNEMMLQEVMNTQSEIISAEEENNEEDASNLSVSFISKNTAKAESERIKNRYDLVEKGYRLGLLVARMDTDWHLYKQDNEKSKKYDYFTLKPVTQIKSYKGIWARSIYTNIDIPSDADQLDDWAPMGDRGASSIGVTLGYPFSVGVSMNFGENLKIDDQSSLAHDYARWKVNDGPTDLNKNISGTTFKPAAGWASTGTYAKVGLTVIGKFDNYITLTTKTNVTYDYAKATY